MGCWNSLKLGADTALKLRWNSYISCLSCVFNVGAETPLKLRWNSLKLGAQKNNWHLCLIFIYIWSFLSNNEWCQATRDKPATNSSECATMALSTPSFQGCPDCPSVFDFDQIQKDKHFCCSTSTQVYNVDYTCDSTLLFHLSRLENALCLVLFGKSDRRSSSEFERALARTMNS